MPAVRKCVQSPWKGNPNPNVFPGDCVCKIPAVVTPCLVVPRLQRAAAESARGRRQLVAFGFPSPRQWAPAGFLGSTARERFGDGRDEAQRCRCLCRSDPSMRKRVSACDGAVRLPTAPNRSKWGNRSTLRLSKACFVVVVWRRRQTNGVPPHSHSCPSL